MRGREERERKGGREGKREREKKRERVLECTARMCVCTPHLLFMLRAREIRTGDEFYIGLKRESRARARAEH